MLHTSTHSVMFHHFHSDRHEPAQGSLSGADFKEMLRWLANNYSLRGAHEYKRMFEGGTLQKSDICLSFDDGLKCQYDVAVPIMNEFGIDAFFFIYSSAFTENPDYLELYRYFRTSAFDGIDEFYKEFFDIVKQNDVKEFATQISLYSGLDYLSAFPFYTENDKWFRYLRDQYLDGGQYQKIMSDLMLVKEFDIDNAKKHLWMSENDLNNVYKQGHTIGLHSYTHPTQMNKLSKLEQEIEYQKNYEHLSKITNSPIKVMSHPCGNYNKDTLEVLSSMGVTIGFRSSMSITDIRSSLEIPREDHANVFKEMQG